MEILVVFAGVLLARIVGDGIAAALIVLRARKRKKTALAQLERWESLLAEAEAKRGPAEITD